VALATGLCSAVSQAKAEERGQLTLNTNVYVILRLLCFSCIFVGFGEGVCERNVSAREVRDKEFTRGQGPRANPSGRVTMQKASFKAADGTQSAGKRKLILRQDKAKDSPKVLRFSIDINSSVPGFPWVGFCWKDCGD
jgi:hypothetical protein